MATLLGAGGLPAAQQRVNKTQSAPSHDFKGSPNLPNQERKKMVYEDGKVEALPPSEDKISVAFINGLIDELAKIAEGNPFMPSGAGTTPATAAISRSSRMRGAAGPATAGAHLIGQEGAKVRMERAADAQAAEQHKKSLAPDPSAKNPLLAATNKRVAAKQRLASMKAKGLFGGKTAVAFINGLLDELAKIAAEK